MSEFKRGMGSICDTLAKESLFTNKLMPDINKGDVFFAIRGGYGSFYYKGCSLFRYEKGKFSTHYKYGFVPHNIPKNDYITEDKLHNMEKETSFFSGYKRIKETAGQYKDVEAEGVSALYKFAPTSLNKTSQYFLVDIEIAFNSLKDAASSGSNGVSRKQDRIDILLYDNLNRTLLFCEAKHFSNHEIWSKEGKLPHVIGQLNKYNKQLADKKNEIIGEYAKAFSEYNSLVGSELISPPESIYNKCGLLIFGFDSLQKEKIHKLLIDDDSLKGHNHYKIGNVKEIQAAQLFSELTK